MAEFLYRIGRACARRARTVLTVWLALLISTAAAFFLFSEELGDALTIPDTPTAEVTDEVAEKFPGASGASGTVVYQTEDGSAFSDEQQEEIAHRIDQAAEVDGIEEVIDPFELVEQQAEGEEELADGREQIEAAWEDLDAGQEELDEARSQAEFAGMLDEVGDFLDAQQAGIDEGRAELEAESEQLERGEALAGMASDIRSVSEDGDTALVRVVFTETMEQIEQDTRDGVMAAFEDDPVPGTTVDFGDDIAFSMPHLFGPAEAIGLMVAAAVLVIMLRTLVGAGLPIVTALVGVGVATLTAMSLSGVLDMVSVTPILGLMLGLAVGIDYSLFIVNRHRRQLKHGIEVPESIGLANGTSGNAVVFAGATVFVALLGLNLTGVGFLGLMGSVAALAVTVAVLVAVTVIPALLSLVGLRILSRRERDERATALSARGHNGATGGAEVRPMSTGGAVGRAAVAILALGVLAVPAFGLRLGIPDGSSEPEDSTENRAYTAVSEHFGDGQNGTLLVAAELPWAPLSGQVEEYQLEVAQELYERQHVEAVAPLGISEDESLALFQVVPVDGPTSETTESLVHTLRGLEPLEGAGELGVAGMASGNIDLSDALSDALPVYLTVVVGLSLVILLLVFRSIFVPVIATLGFVLSYFAALGSVVAVYQWGWLGAIFGVQTPGPVLNFLPTLVAGVLFGLAMDYMLFVGTGMREAYAKGRPARQAVVEGFRAGRAVVTAAAIIMASVFGGFIFSETVMIGSIGFALAFGVLFDAFVVRMMLIPAVMHLVGDAAWWIPRWLDRILPDIDVEGAKLEHSHHHDEEASSETQQEEQLQPVR
jgi:putative drug exporter of the RND superfamily